MKFLHLDSRFYLSRELCQQRAERALDDAAPVGEEPATESGETPAADSRSAPPTGSGSLRRAEEGSG